MLADQVAHFCTLFDTLALLHRAKWLNFDAHILLVLRLIGGSLLDAHSGPLLNAH